MKRSKYIWIQAGYSLFAREGKTALNVDKIAKIINKSRSSFYHNFFNLEVFEEELFEYHFQQTKIFFKEGKKIDTLMPEYVQLMGRYKDWVFFQQQLFLIRHEDEKYINTFDRVRNVTEEKTALLWIKSAGLDKLPLPRVRQFFILVRETFYTRLNYDNYTPEILTDIINDINESFQFLLKDDLNKTG